MPDLITITETPIGHKTVSAIDARDLHAKLGVRRNFSNWVNQVAGNGDWIENQDFIIMNAEVHNSPGPGRPQELSYIFSMEMAEHIAMMTRTPRGREVRNYFRDARDERDALKAKTITAPVPATRGDMLVQMAEAYRVQEQKLLAIEAEQAATQAILIATQQQTIKALTDALEAKAISARAEDKADIALQDSSHLTVEEFIGRNGLLHQFPYSQHAVMAAWVKKFCQEYALPFWPDTVIGKSWETENHYPVQALLAYIRYASKRPQQIALVPDAKNE